jgi:hypothetical protein
MTVMTSKALTAPAVELAPSLELGRRLREALANLKVFLETAQTGAAASYEYERLTARGMPSPEAAQRVYWTHYSSVLGY